MLNIIPIILILVSLTGIVWLVLKHLPELQKEGTGRSFRSGKFDKKSFGSMLSAVGRFMADSAVMLFNKSRDLFVAAKSEFNHVRNVKRNVGNEKRKMRRTNRIEEEKRVSVADMAEIDEAREYFENGQLVKAEEAAIEILKNDPGFLPAYELLGEVYLGRKNWLEAAEVYRYLLKKSSKNEEYWRNLGESLSGLEDYEEAVDSYKKSLAIYPRSSTFISLGLAYQALTDYVNACRALESALDLEPENAQVLLLLGENYIHREDFQSAEDVFEQVLEIEPGNHIAKERLMQLKI